MFLLLGYFSFSKSKDRQRDERLCRQFLLKTGMILVFGRKSLKMFELSSKECFKPGFHERRKERKHNALLTP